MVTINDVALLAGVSTATVSRAISEPEKVSPLTRKKVMDAISKSGYITNSMARNFRTGRTNVVVVLVPDISNSFFSSIIRGIENFGIERHFRILLGDTQNNIDREQAYSDLVCQRQADGIICLGMNIPFKYKKGRKSIDPQWPPFVMACEYDGIIPAPTVCIDNVSAAADAIRHLTTLNHKKIAFINGPASSPLCRDRLHGVNSALHLAGIHLPSHWLKWGDFTMQSGFENMNEILNTRPYPSALFCANDAMAAGAMRAARERGLDIPNDLSIVGFDDIEITEYLLPSLTTIRQPREVIGMQSMKLMLSIIKGENIETKKIVLEHELIIRDSTKKYTK